MDDNPDMTERVKRRYHTMHTGVFYRRFVLGEWRAADGLIYDGFDENIHTYTELPKGVAENRRYIAVDYGTTNPMTFLEMLNLVSMDFDIHTRYSDELRYNSFMRPRNTRSSGFALGNGFYKGVFPKNKGSDFPILRGETLAKWKAAYGGSVVDFGAGKLLNTIILRKSGISVSAFKPYFIGVSDDIHKQTSLEITAEFLEDVKRGKQYDTVFISSVFNSVPFMQDRKYIATICSALCSRHTKLVCWTQAEGGSQVTQIKHGNLDKNAVKQTTFLLEYEPNIVLGDIIAHPKVQKFHSRQEMIEIFEPVFHRIDRLENIHDFWYLEASQAKPVDKDALKEALEFEFELPYPDGTRMGMSERAKEAFAVRLGLTFD
ncbi:MAG: class I SAM-dependent methyltransferase [Clostridium sp.]|jgi:hypothetical protein|nr:class I SAM-dependent methyltransferase [Clostridium sp.]